MPTYKEIGGGILLIRTQPATNPWRMARIWGWNWHNEARGQCFNSPEWLMVHTAFFGCASSRRHSLFEFCCGSLLDPPAELQPTRTTISEHAQLILWIEKTEQCNPATWIVHGSVFMAEGWLNGRDQQLSDNSSRPGELAISKFSQQLLWFHSGSATALNVRLRVATIVNAVCLIKDPVSLAVVRWRHVDAALVGHIYGAVNEKMESLHVKVGLKKEVRGVEKEKRKMGKWDTALMSLWVDIENARSHCSIKSSHISAPTSHAPTSHATGHPSHIRSSVLSTTYAARVTDPASTRHDMAHHDGPNDHALDSLWSCPASHIDWRMFRTGSSLSSSMTTICLPHTDCPPPMYRALSITGQLPFPPALRISSSPFDPPRCCSQSRIWRRVCYEGTAVVGEAKVHDWLCGDLRISFKNVWKGRRSVSVPTPSSELKAAQ